MQTTCPPHVHQLNGVAERAIRSVLEHVRVNLVASNLPVSFWAYAAQHVVDVLNRTTGPPNSDLTRVEVMRGEQPKVMWASCPLAAARTSFGQRSTSARATSRSARVGGRQPRPQLLLPRRIQRLWVPDGRWGACTGLLRRRLLHTALLPSSTGLLGCWGGDTVSSPTSSALSLTTAAAF